MPRFSKLKKLLAGLLAIALLAGCAGKSRRPEPPPAPKPAQQTPQDSEKAAREDPESGRPKEAEPEPSAAPESSAAPEAPEESALPETPAAPQEPLRQTSVP